MAPKGKVAIKGKIQQKIPPPMKSLKTVKNPQKKVLKKVGSDPIENPKDKSNDTSDIQKRIEAFQKDVKDQGMQDTPDISLFKKHFSSSQMSYLWTILKRARGKCEMDAKSAWQAIQDMKSGKNEAKLKVLFNKLVLPEGMWQTRMVDMVERIEKSKETKKNKEWLTKGQLVQQHGWDEAMEMISSGKVERAEDSDGDSIYIRKSKSASNTHKHSASVSTSRTGRASCQQLDDLTQSFEAWFSQGVQDAIAVPKSKAKSKATAKGKAKAIPLKDKAKGSGSHGMLALEDGDVGSMIDDDTKDEEDSQEKAVDKAINKIATTITKLQKIKQAITAGPMSKPVLIKLGEHIQSGESLKKDFIKFANKACKKDFDRFMKMYISFINQAKDLQQKAKVHVNK